MTDSVLMKRDDNSSYVIFTMRYCIFLYGTELFSFVLAGIRADRNEGGSDGSGCASQGWGVVETVEVHVRYPKQRRNSFVRFTSREAEYSGHANIVV